MASKYRIFFSIDKAHADKFAEKFPNENPNQWAKEIILDHIDGDACTIQPNDDKQIEKEITKEKLTFMQKRNENYTYKNKIDKVKADHAETFGKLPSRLASHAINQRFENERPIEQPITTTSNNQGMAFARPPDPQPNFKIIENGAGGYKAICLICNNENETGWRIYEDAAIEDITFHLSMVHNKPPYRNLPK